MFDHPDQGQSSSQWLLKLRQGTEPAMDFSISFCILAAYSGWNNEVLITVFSVFTELTCRDTDLDLDELITLGIRLDQHLRGKAHPIALASKWPARLEGSSEAHQPSVPGRASPRQMSPEPMQLGASGLPEQERRRQMRGKLCLYWEEKGHFFAECPTLWKKDRVAHYASTIHCMEVLFYVTNSPVSLSVLIYSGLVGNFMSSSLLHSLSIPVEKIASLVSVNILDGHLISNAPVTLITSLLRIAFPQPTHSETFQFYVLPQVRTDMVLGLPWLCKHNPVVDWQSAQMVSWSERCSMAGHTSPIPLRSRSVESPNAHLPVHGDCAIDLLPGSTPPRAHVYSLSLTETRAMEKFMAKALKQGLISRLTSPAAAEFLFIEKKDGGFRPCIDYRRLNKVTEKYLHLLLLILAAFTNSVYQAGSPERI